jgi:hypothetical protein
LACAALATPACCRIWARLRLAVSAAKSASMMRLRAAAWFSTPIWSAAITLSKRLCDAPIVARSLLILSSAASMLVMTVASALLSAAEPMPARPAPALFVPATTVMVESVDRLVVAMSIASLLVTLAPTWKVWVPASAPRMVLPLKTVPPRMRCTSLASSPNSLSSDSLSLAELVALRDWIASSRMRWSASPA